jgi:hypothetical protein
MKFRASLTATIVSRRWRLQATEGCGVNEGDRPDTLNGWLHSAAARIEFLVTTGAGQAPGRRPVGEAEASLPESNYLVSKSNSCIPVAARLVLSSRAK